MPAERRQKNGWLSIYETEIRKPNASQHPSPEQVQSNNATSETLAFVQC